MVIPSGEVYDPLKLRSTVGILQAECLAIRRTPSPSPFERKRLFNEARRATVTLSDVFNPELADRLEELAASFFDPTSSDEILLPHTYRLAAWLGIVDLEVRSVLEPEITEEFGRYLGDPFGPVDHPIPAPKPPPPCPQV